MNATVRQSSPVQFLRLAAAALISIASTLPASLEDAASTFGRHAHERREVIGRIPHHAVNFLRLEQRKQPRRPT